MERKLVDEATQTLEAIRTWDSEHRNELSDAEDSGYGHALRSLGARLEGRGSRPQEEQKRLLAEEADKLVKKYGQKIRGVLKPELLEALDIKGPVD